MEKFMCPFIVSNTKQLYAHDEPQFWTQSTKWLIRCTLWVVLFSPVLISCITPTIKDYAYILTIKVMKLYIKYVENNSGTAEILT